VLGSATGRELIRLPPPRLPVFSLERAPSLRTLPPPPLPRASPTVKPPPAAAPVASTSTPPVMPPPPPPAPPAAKAVGFGDVMAFSGECILLSGHTYVSSTRRIRMAADRLLSALCTALQHSACPRPPPPPCHRVCTRVGKRARPAFSNPFLSPPLPISRHRP
jgi:hypothetical protein